MRLYPSVLAADFSCPSPALTALERSGFSHLHLDVMDGHFVPNISFGPPVIRSLTEAHPNLRYDAHLMIDDPDAYLDPLLEMGMDSVSVHAEVEPGLEALQDRCRQAGTQLGLAFNPATPLDRFLEWIPRMDFILIMSVQPGFGGQSFRKEVLPKIARVRELTSAPIQVDGGINADTIRDAARHGARWFVAGSAVFRSESPPQAARELRSRAEGS